MRKHTKPAPKLVKKAEDTKPAAGVLRQKRTKGLSRISRDAVAPSTTSKIAAVNSGTTVVCPGCAKSFVKRRVYPPQRFCSRNCRQSHWRRTQQGYLARVRQTVAGLARAEGAIDDPLEDRQIAEMLDRMDPLKDPQIAAMFHSLDPLKDPQIVAMFDALDPNKDGSLDDLFKL
jgi:hypothetical protein